MRQVAERFAPDSRRLNDVRRTTSIEERVEAVEVFSFGLVIGHEDSLPGGPRYDGANRFDGSIVYGGPRRDRLEIVILDRRRARRCDRSFERGAPAGEVRVQGLEAGAAPLV